MGKKPRSVGKKRRPLGRCHYCGTTGRMTTDHIIPRAAMGLNFAWNLVPSCLPCNQAKAAQMPSCRCAWCQTAIDLHWQWICGQPFRVQQHLIKKTRDLYITRYGALHRRYGEASDRQ